MGRRFRPCKNSGVVAKAITLFLLLSTSGCGGGDDRASTQDDASGDVQAAATLRWQAPSQRMDGESLSMAEIAGYRIYYGTSPGNYSSVVTIDDPYASSVLIEDLPEGTYYFAMTTLDTTGAESSFSPEAVRNISA
jgi:hypothetical protein